MRNPLLATQDPGLGEKDLQRKRIVNKDGSFNLKRTGMDPSVRDMYQWLINSSWTEFLAFAFAMYVLVNLVFACIYLLIGTDQLTGANASGLMSRFGNAFFFSTQTLTTVGYGAISPVGVAANMVAAVEAFVGLSGFALLTGLLYGRFSKPNSRILYSNNALIAPFKDGMSLQFRLVNKRRNVLMDMHARVLISYLDKESGNRKYYRLPLEIESIHFFPMNWTIVHAINEASPLFGLTASDLEDLDAEILILIKGFDDTFGQDVHSRFSYKYDEVVFNAKFKSAYHTNSGRTEMDINKIHDHELLSDK